MLAGLLLPGAMLLRALRLPWSLAAAFAASSATLYVVVLVFTCTGVTISLLTLASALGLVALAGRLVPVRASATELNSSFACFTKMGHWLPLYLAFWAIVGYRLVAQPLSGPDVYFRWSWLAEQMLQFGSLDFYPPRSSGDFVRYYWAESIPPGIASLYAWVYGCGGSRQALWTSPVIALQLLSLHEIIWRLASRWGGEIVARRAVLLAAACPLLTWSVLIGQETGLTALAVCGLVWCLHHQHEKDGFRWAALAGIFTVMASSTREYGPVFVVAAIAATIFLHAPRRHTLVLALIALPVAAVWPLRVRMLTGNPFYSLNLGGLFRVNQIFTAWNDTFRGSHQFALTSLANWQALGRYWLLWALPATAGIAGLVILLIRRLREAQVVAGVAALVLALWFVSVSYTAGGLFYSLRVLSPAFALLVVVASYALGLLNRHPAAGKFTALAVALVLVEALPKTLVLPENPYRAAVRDWPQAGGQFIASVRAEEQELLAKLKPLLGRRRIISDDAGMPRVFAAINTDVAPLWSPEVAWLFDTSLKPEAVARRWQKSGFRYLVLGKSGPTADFVRAHAQWRAPYFTLKPVAETETHLVLEATVAEAPPP
jgi:hypothetical protein